MNCKSSLIGRLKAAGYRDPSVTCLSDSELVGLLKRYYQVYAGSKFESRDIPDSETNGFIDASGKTCFKGPII
jgi:hypothetical protein